MHVNQGLDHLVYYQSDGFFVELPLRCTLQHIEKCVLHELEHNEYMGVIVFLSMARGLLREASEELDDVRVTLQKLEKGDLPFGNPLCLLC